MRKITLLCGILIGISFGAADGSHADPHYQSQFMAVTLESDQPAFATIAVDSLGKNNLIVTPLWASPAPTQKYDVSRAGSKIEYRVHGAAAKSPAAGPHRRLRRRRSTGRHHSRSAGDRAVCCTGSWRRK